MSNVNDFYDRYNIRPPSGGQRDFQGCFWILVIIGLLLAIPIGGAVILINHALYNGANSPAEATETAIVRFCSSGGTPPVALSLDQVRQDATNDLGSLGWTAIDGSDHVTRETLKDITLYPGSNPCTMIACAKVMELNPDTFGRAAAPGLRPVIRKYTYEYQSVLYQPTISSISYDLKVVWQVDNVPSTTSDFATVTSCP